MPTAEAFWSQVDRQGEHWLWRGPTTPNGYGQLRYRGGRILAHRLAAVLLELVPPDQLCLYRVRITCAHRLCIRCLAVQPYQRIAPRHRPLPPPLLPSP
jgi:hypothetical protein